MLIGMTPAEPLSSEDMEQQMLTAESYQREMPSLSDIYMERASDPDSLRIARVYFDKKEYRRCAHALKECNDQKSLFLRLYARYMVTISNNIVINITINDILMCIGWRERCTRYLYGCVW
jgi:hypothetical protein